MSDIIWGAAAIAREAGIVDEDGEVGDDELRKAFYLLELGLLPGRKVGRRWTSTKSAIRARFEINLNNAAE